MVRTRDRDSSAAMTKEKSHVSAMRIQTTGEEIGRITLGLGWNTWAWRDKPLRDKAWEQLLSLFVESRCRWVRLDVHQSDWELRDSRACGYDFDTPRMKSLYRWLDACERHDIPAGRMNHPSLSRCHDDDAGCLFASRSNSAPVIVT